MIILSDKIHMVKEETLEGGPKGGGKEELGEERSEEHTSELQSL